MSNNNDLLVETSTIVKQLANDLKDVPERLTRVETKMDIYEKALDEHKADDAGKLKFTLKQLLIAGGVVLIFGAVLGLTGLEQVWTAVGSFVAKIFT